MPSDTVLLRDTGTGAIVPVPLASYREALASGRYEAYGGSTATVAGPATGGVESSPEEALAHTAVGESTVGENERMVQEMDAARRASLDTAGDKVLTFAEGVVDAISAGFIHEHGDEADIRRDVNSGSAFMGELAGTALGLKLPGPLKWTAEAGENVGRSAARAVFGESELAGRALGEAGSGASMMGATAFGHQVSDAVIDNKPMSAEAIIHEVGLGALLGGGFGLLGGLVGRAASKAEVAGGSGIEELTTTASKHAETVLRELDGALEKHAATIGAIKEAAEAGVELPGNFLAEKQTLLGLAKSARADLEKAGSAADALEGSPEEFTNWQKAHDAYHKSVMDVDDALRPATRQPEPAIEASASIAAPPKPVFEQVDEFARTPPTGTLGDLNSALGLPPPTPPSPAMQAVDGWTAGSDAVKVATPGDRALANIQQSLDDLVRTSKARLDSAGALELTKAEGIPDATTQLSERLQQVRGLRQAAGVASKASKSVAGVAKRADEAAAKMVKTGMGHALGSILGGPLGGAAGAVLGLKSAGFAGRIAGTMGRVRTAALKAADAILKGGRGRLVARAAAGRRPWAYSETGPIKDPMQRIVEIQHLAANPQMIQARVTSAAGDLNAISPETVAALNQLALTKIQSLSLHAPAFMMDKWGSPIAPAAGQMRKWLDYEAGHNDLLGSLIAFERGTVSREQAQGFREGHPEFAQVLAKALLADPERLSALPPEKLRLVEYATGIPLVVDGKAILRQQSAWMTAKAGSPAQNQQGQAAQAFRIGPNTKFVQTTSTPSQSYNGRAPGN